MSVSSNMEPKQKNQCKVTIGAVKDLGRDNSHNVRYLTARKDIAWYTRKDTAFKRPIH